MLRHDKSAFADLEDFIAEVSSPSHPRYGQYLSAAELKDALPPVDGAQEAVLAFLSQHNVPSSMVSTSLSGDMISAKISVGVAKKMFEADFQEYENPQAAKSIVRAARGYTVPQEVQNSVYIVGNLLELPSVNNVILVPDDETEDAGSTAFGGDCDSCKKKVTPGVLAQAYNFTIEQGPTVSGDTGMATAEFQIVYYDDASLTKFHDDCHLPYDVKVDSQIGPNKEGHCLSGDPCTEALLDIEYAKATSGGSSLTNIFNGDYSYLDWFKNADDLGDAGPAVHSISYGDDEIQNDDDAPSGSTGIEYMFAVNTQFAKLAARGVSVLVASGDQGVCGRSGCRAVFHPGFPASSPYVTAVGGTDFVTKSQVGDEMAWSSSGGGFSNTFAQPKWQKQAVDAYLKSNASGAGLPPATAFNSSGRAFPDVAALGGQRNPFCVAQKRFPGIEHMAGVSGTSASCPVFAGLVARLNTARLQKGLPRMGLLNPWIYEHPEMFGDVTQGKNDHGYGDGFEAVPGWDPATGMGTPRFDAMLAAALEAGTVVNLV